ncbi:MAG: cytochrome c3 family protein [Candidatus Rokubacteria bacterium]|nr:cytochrome c3 family protein [Candidatus Rokubacteria bacterium]
MRYTGLGSLAVTIVFALGLMAASPGFAQVKPPPDMSFDKGKDSPGTVTFSHEKHVAAGNKCTSCHVKVFKMKKGQTGPLTMEKMKAGEQCGACHTGKAMAEGKTPFALADTANCEKCHKK